MKILVVSSFLPYPLFSGGHIRLYNLLRRLSLNHDITLVCEKRDYQTDQDIEEIKKFCRLKVFNRKKQWSYKNILYAGFSAFPFLMVGHANKSMKDEIEKILSNEKFDLIHVETFYVMQNVPSTTLPIILVEHNIEYLVYQRFTNLMPLVLRPLLYVDILKLKYWEKRFWKKATKLIAVSDEEKQIMDRSDVEIVPNGVDVNKFKVKSEKFQIDKKEKRILFIGDFKWMQNRNAAEWILKELWPRINSLDLKLWIVGKNIPANIKSKASGNVFFDEDAPTNTEEIFKMADLLIAPIVVGGGTSYKILEAMACGVPVVTTSLGIEGIDARAGREVIIAETANDFADKIQSLLKNKTLHDTLSKNARSLIEKKYNWDIIVGQLEKVYKLAIKRND